MSVIFIYEKGKLEKGRENSHDACQAIARKVVKDIKKKI